MELLVYEIKMCYLIASVVAPTIITRLLSGSNCGEQKGISKYTTHQTLRWMGYNMHKQVPLKSAMNRNLRLSWVHAQPNWTVEDWEKLRRNRACKDKQFFSSGILIWVAGSMEPIPGDSRQKVRDTLDRVPTHRKAQMHTHSHITDNVKMPISLQHMSLDWGRKLEYPQSTGTICKLHTQGRAGNRMPNPGGVLFLTSVNLSYTVEVGAG
ncbi:hypothetical protein AMELA_G00018180 [Ameiurus melas]|uniref:Transposase Tc1-like domain-containing protein n=1 Tax=Ameiurus melas TaxID=219545 RepID=A0A7J6BAX9_AMEME|nr:hypothetical protein AMELA_G00018180 [Ameiurus melas]